MNQVRDYLFSEMPLLEFIQKRVGNLVAEVNAVNENELVECNVEEFVQSFVEKYSLEPIVLLADRIETTLPTEAKIDVRHDPLRMIRDRSRPVYVAGAAVTFIIPFTGDEDILRFTPQTFHPNPPHGTVVANEIHITYQDITIDEVKMKASFDNDLRNIQQFVEWGAGQVKEHNARLPTLIRGRLDERKRKILQARQSVKAIGFPVRERANAPQLYSVPVQRKKVTIAHATPVGQPSSQGQFVDMAAYEDILKTLGSMARVLELNPKAFAEMDEESLRFMLLVPLNVHYEGQATGETFNWEGKTDIIIKVGGRNIFIAECKIWKGAEVFNSTIDQLLGYTSWRDTKTAIILFNRNKNLSAVLSQIPVLVKEHPNFKHEVSTYKNETGFRFVLHHRDDKNRELTLTVLVFDVPA